MQWDYWEDALYYAKGISTMLLSPIKYRITHMLFPKLYAAITFFFTKKKTCVSLPIRYDIAMGLKGQED